MLDSTSVFQKLEAFAAPPLPVLDKITGHFLARNRLSPEARIALALRMVRGDEPVTGFTVAQVARLCRVPRAKLDQHLGRHRNVGDALVKAFRRASSEQRIAFVRAIGSEEIWNTLQAAL